MSKLYEVEFMVRVVVLADDENHAYAVAEQNAFAIFRDDPRDDIFVCGEIKYANQLPQGWDAECLPYGGQDQEIGDYLENPTPEHDTKTIDMFIEAAQQQSAQREKGGDE